MRLYERCREARRRTGLSQESLALELHVSRGAVAQWEMERGTSPAVDNLIALSRRSGLAFEWLATDRGPRVFGDPRIEEDAAPYGSLTARQLQMLKVFDRLPKARQQALLDFLKPGES
jgi:transcriptional regulator with XRE-family HTH domain